MVVSIKICEGCGRQIFVPQLSNLKYCLGCEHLSAPVEPTRNGRMHVYKPKPMVVGESPTVTAMRKRWMEGAGS